VPQGGGDRYRGHRCPGEDVTLGVLTALVPRIAELSYVVAGPRPGLRRMPPEPACRIEVTR
jgi:fatty-acid peroxygenase